MVRWVFTTVDTARPRLQETDDPVAQLVGIRQAGKKRHGVKQGPLHLGAWRFQLGCVVGLRKAGRPVPEQTEDEELQPADLGLQAPASDRVQVWTDVHDAALQALTTAVLGG